MFSKCFVLFEGWNLLWAFLRPAGAPGQTKSAAFSEGGAPWPFFRRSVPSFGERNGWSTQAVLLSFFRVLLRTFFF